MTGLKVGWALCGSFCTFSRILPVIQALRDTGADITPIFSENAYSTDTRFGTAEFFRAQVEGITGNNIIHTIAGAEPIGPKGLFDLLIIAPATGNTLAKITHGITDSCVSMAAKSHLRGGKPLLLAVSTNDGLSGSAANIGTLLNRKNVFFVPFCQDDPVAKPTSLVADMECIPEIIPAVLSRRQPQPVLIPSRL